MVCSPPKSVLGYNQMNKILGECLVKALARKWVKINIVVWLKPALI